MLPIRVLLLAPRSGSTGPSDYANELVAALRPHVAEIVELRHGAPGEDSWADVRHWRREVRRLLSRPGDLEAVVHAELSGGSLTGFWALAAAPGARRTATIHDPPRSVWFPFRSRLVARHRLLGAVLRRVLDRPGRVVERRVMRGVGTIVLSPGGAEALAALGDLEPAEVGHLFPPPAPQLPPAVERPLAVGLFGHNYTGKGFDRLAEIRRSLPPEIAIRVAGRGTEDLPETSGVELLGTLPAAELDSFFASIRLLLMPYDRVPIGGIVPVPASLTHLTALAHGTPVLARASTQMESLAASGGALVVPGDARELALAAAALVTDPARLQSACDEAATHLRSYRPELSTEPYLRLWAAR